MAHKHSVYDTDLHFSIDPITRGITNLAKDKTTIIQHDHNSERFTFEIPRYVDGHDMSLCNVVQVHYLNIEAAHKDNGSAGIYEVEDLQISPDGDDVVILSWLISGNATRYVGSLNFVVRFSCVTDSTVDYAWNTAVFSGISVSTGICNSDVIIEEYADILLDWERRITALEQSGAVELDTTLTVSGKAADAGAVGEYFTRAMMTISGELANKQPKGNYVQTVNGQTPDESGNVIVEAGGGASSWNDLTDRPFYEEGSIEELVAEQEYSGFAYLSALGLYGKSQMEWFSLQEGEKYIVRWHGEEWSVTAFKMAQQGMEAIVLGNEKLLSGESTTPVEPFVVYQITANNYCAVCAFDQEASHTFGIFKDSTVIHPLDAKFLPSPTSIDLSQYESNGRIVETFADGTTKTTIVEFDGNGKPVKITDSAGNIMNLNW